MSDRYERINIVDASRFLNLTLSSFVEKLISEKIVLQSNKNDFDEFLDLKPECLLPIKEGNIVVNPISILTSELVAKCVWFANGSKFVRPDGIYKELVSDDFEEVTFQSKLYTAVNISEIYIYLNTISMI